MSKAPIADMPEFYGHPAPREAVNIKLEYKADKESCIAGHSTRYRRLGVCIRFELPKLQADTGPEYRNSSSSRNICGPMRASIDFEASESSQDTAS